MDRQPVLEGERVLLRPLAEEDWAALYAAGSDPKIWTHYPFPDRWKEPNFRVYFEEGLAKKGALAVIDKSSGRIVGSSRFQYHCSENGGQVEIGWTFLAREVWGTGINTEMKRLMLRHALDSVERVIFHIGENNVISRRAIEKIGGRLTDQIDVLETADGSFPHVVYEITRKDFEEGPLNS
ncbi:GNAT family N-acetyltransferase [Altererythrobacter arenosus]|uniref:GNAT family N-acetyltransferase n=1 Tax=Altererythrobacter arenosus TaxID=3032592 RepID=A0ABY8FVU1_9SPHN|nr:GNAT family N-acetyltransferase [Altererythrobacter sp. CAU 1644]WFL78215.1 GNAT family N-acetyltransferase [Altererythrobacter sp. CAU 1644]